MAVTAPASGTRPGRDRLGRRCARHAVRARQLARDAQRPLGRDPQLVQQPGRDGSDALLAGLQPADHARSSSSTRGSAASSSTSTGSRTLAPAASRRSSATPPSSMRAAPPRSRLRPCSTRSPPGCANPRTANRCCCSTSRITSTTRPATRRRRRPSREQLGDLLFAPAGPGCTQLPGGLSRDDVRAVSAQVLIVSDCGIGSGWPGVASAWDDHEEGQAHDFTDYPACGPDYSPRRVPRPPDPLLRGLDQPLRGRRGTRAIGSPPRRPRPWRAAEST